MLRREKEPGVFRPEKRPVQGGGQIQNMSAGVRIPVLNVEVSGAGAWQSEPLALRWIELDRDLVRTLPGVTGTGGLEAVRLRDDSMEPAIPAKAWCLIDRGQREASEEGVYCLCCEGRIFLKRIRRRPDGSVLLLSDNPRFFPMVLDGEELEGLHVTGRLVGVFGGGDFGFAGPLEFSAAQSRRA